MIPLKDRPYSCINIKRTIEIEQYNKLKIINKQLENTVKALEQTNTQLAEAIKELKSPAVKTAMNPGYIE